MSLDINGRGARQLLPCQALSSIDLANLVIQLTVSEFDANLRSFRMTKPCLQGEHPVRTAHLLVASRAVARLFGSFVVLNSGLITSRCDGPEPELDLLESSRCSVLANPDAGVGWVGARHT